MDDCLPGREKNLTLIMSTLTPTPTMNICPMMCVSWIGTLLCCILVVGVSDVVSDFT